MTLKDKTKRLLKITDGRKSFTYLILLLYCKVLDKEKIWQKEQENTNM